MKYKCKPFIGSVVLNDVDNKISSKYIHMYKNINYTYFKILYFWGLKIKKLKIKC